MSIQHVELTDTFDAQRQRLNTVIDAVNANPAVSPGNGISAIGGTISVKKRGDGLNFDSDGYLVGNDAYPNLLTQVVFDPNGPSTVPTVISQTGITFPAFSVIFGSKVYYGKEIADFVQVDVPSTTMNVASGDNGVVFVYVDTSGEIHQSMTPITPENSSVQCLLGSYFRISNKIQTNSWKYTPWNGATSKDNRFATGGSVSGGLLTAKTTNTLARSSINVVLEGVNASTSIYNPNSITYSAESPYLTKELWPGYDPSALDSSTLDTTHIYNMTSHTVDDISSKTGFIILIPGIVTPTGQDVYLMAMSTKSGSNYPQIYSTMNDAVDAIYGYQVDLGNVTTRVSWLGQVIVVKIGATDYTDSTQLQVIGQVPNVLGSYVSLPGSASSVKIEGLTIKDEGITIGSESTKTTLNFASGVTITNISENSADIYIDDQVRPRITNCIIGMNQDINLTLSSGTLTLKAGSKIYMPNGFEQDGTTPKFDVVTIDSDKSVNIYGTTGQTMVFVRADVTVWGNVTIDKCLSGTTVPENYTGMFYKTDENKIYYYSGGVKQATTFSLPLSVITASSGTVTAIDKVFNGLGFIGRTFYVLPGVKAFHSNGYNSDGTLKNDLVTVNQVIIFTGGVNNTTSQLILNRSGTSCQFASSASEWVYDSYRNTFYYTANGDTAWVDVGTYYYDSTAGYVTQFNSKYAFRGLEYHDYIVNKTNTDNKISVLEASQAAILQQSVVTTWPSSTSVSEWPHTIYVSISSAYTLPTTAPTYTNKILTWEVLVKNTSSSSVSLTWPAIYKAFNGESLPILISGNTTLFFIMRKYSNNYVLVSSQGSQSNSEI